MRTGFAAFGDPQHVAGVTVAVQAQAANLSGDSEAAPYTCKREVDDGDVGVDEIRRQEAVFEQPALRFFAEPFDVETRSEQKRLARSDRMNATDETPEPFSRGALLELGRPTAALGIDGEPIAGEGMEGSLARQRQRR